MSVVAIFETASFYPVFFITNETSPTHFEDWGLTEPRPDPMYTLKL